MLTNRLHGFLLFNFLVKDDQNLVEVLEAGKGYVVPGITAADHSIEEGIQKVRTFKKHVDMVSIGLGGNGNPENWKKALTIASTTGAGHLNQPFERASYAQGYCEGQGKRQWVNALVAPTGEVGQVQLSSGQKMSTHAFVDLVYTLGIPSIKLMPIKGLTHLDELVDLTRKAAYRGIEGIEPAGGISVDNIVNMVEAVQTSGIKLFMPHIFGSTIDPQTKRTIPEQVAMILEKVSG
ncbi:2-dehydro-3-deoxy-phosphogluconate aldolase [Seinonella peptonophila]|uniref:2-dehydro-3-deoxy-phosphogluconate aldolase n=1 Tax=Seinonella peptonophila TaxID=112248 RepID=A0A1M4SX57_9BACL|nr:KDGP aldolase [Seinonella peptonophila]SHE36823.1 2-dehydro-3-deoxy-phosphogluconate aldolase [Seinonella peptonophila]